MVSVLHGATYSCGAILVPTISSVWLERYLTKDFKGILVVVSQDRHFLNEVVTDVVHFHQGKLLTYRGDISNFTAVREENRKRQIRLYEQQEAKRAHLQKYIDLHAESGENGVKASKQRKSRMKKLDKLGMMAAGEGKKFKASYDGEAKEIEEYEEDEEVVLNFPDPGGFDSNCSGPLPVSTLNPGRASSSSTDNSAFRSSW